MASDIFTDMGLDDVDTQFHLRLSDFVVTSAAGTASGFYSQMKAEYLADGGSAGTFDTHFKNFITTVQGDTSINNWTTFINAWRAQENITIPTGPYNGTAFTGIYGDYSALLRLYDPNSFNSGWGDLFPLATWSVPQGPLELSNFGGGNERKTNFDAAFGKFLEINRQFPTTTTSAFVNAWSRFMGGTGFGTQVTAGFNDISNPDFGTSFVNIQSYERMFYAFYPTATPEQFLAMAANFATKCVADQGYFLPSHFVENWLDVLLKPGALTIDPMEEIKSDQAAILNEVFALLAEMIGVIQKVAIVQAARLDFLGQWQKAYSDLMAQVPVLSETNMTDSTQRGLTQPVLTNLLDNLRTERQIITDESKQFQSTLSQSQDAASQQASIASSILQQMSGILANIFR